MRLFLRFFLLTAICLLPLALRATIMIPLSVENLGQRAELILHGTVVGKSCLKDPEGRIYTRIEFKVNEVWKGTLSTNTFVIVQAGGTVGDERTVVDGEASYEVGEELISFLRLNQRGEGVSIGLAQGKFTVWKDGATGGRFAYNLFHGRTKGDEISEQATTRATAGKPARLGLQELLNRATGAVR
jgi:hypothetical protein